MHMLGSGSGLGLGPSWRGGVGVLMAASDQQRKEGEAKVSRSDRERVRRGDRYLFPLPARVRFTIRWASRELGRH